MDMENTSPPSGHGRSIIGRVKPMIRKGMRAAQYSYARAMRRSVPFFEKVMPPLGRRMRALGWIWQPTYSHRWFNKFYSDTVDPYHFDGTSYEKGKYDHTLRLLEGRKYERALEVGAAEGVFTRILAPLCSSLVAVEVAESAVARAKERLVDCTNVTFVQAALPNEMPEGNFDLILASDVLYYFPKDVVLELLALFEERLNPGGILFALHYLGNFRQTTMGRDVHDLMKSRTKLEQVHEETVEGVGPQGATDGYTITIFRKPVATMHV